MTAQTITAHSGKDSPTPRINVERGDQRRPLAELALKLID
jgi:hypothetical protein